METIDRIKNIAVNTLTTKKVGFTLEDLGDCIHFEPCTNDTRKLNLLPGHFDGKQINYWKIENSFELSEYMAGKNQNELHLLGSFKTFKAALSALISGRKIRPLKIYN